MRVEKKERHTFDDLQRLDNITALKLLMYMNEYIDRYNIRRLRYRYNHEDLLNADFDYAFNLWLSLDYVNKNGQSMIDSMINDKMGDLTSEEINLLMMKRESYLSLYRVESYSENLVCLEDLVLNEKIYFWKLDDILELNQGDYFAGRLIWYKDQMLNIGQYKSIEPECSAPMIYSINQKYKFLVDNVEMYSKRYYLKKHSFAVYSIIFEIEDEFLKRKKDIKVEEELKSFRYYLSINRGLSEKTIGAYDLNLRNLYKHTLRNRYKTLNEITEDSIYEYLICACINQKCSIGKLRSTLLSLRHYISHIELLGLGSSEYEVLRELCKERNYFDEIYERLGDRGEKLQLSYLLDEDGESASMSKEWKDEWAMPVVKRMKKEPILLAEINEFMRDLSNGFYKYKSRKIDLETIEDENQSRKIIIYENFSRHMGWVNIDYEDRIIFDTHRFDLFKSKTIGARVVEFVVFLWFDFNWDRLASGIVNYDPMEYSERHRYLEHLLGLPIGIEKDFDQWRLGMNRDEYKFVKTGFKIYKSKIFIPFVINCFYDLGLIKLGQRKENIALEWLHGLNIQTIMLTKLGREVLYYLLLKGKRIEDEKKIVYLDL